MNNYVLLSSWGKPNIQCREWLAQEEDDKNLILSNERVMAGDEVYVISSQKTYVLGLDGTWEVKASGGSVDISLEMNGDWGATLSSAAAGDDSPITKTFPAGGVWCELVDEGGGTYSYLPFASYEELPPMLNGRTLSIGFNDAADIRVDEHTRLYISGSVLHIPANDTLGTPEAVIAPSGYDANGKRVYSAYLEDTDPTQYAEAKFEEVTDDTGAMVGLRLVSAVLGIDPSTTQDITGYFPMLGAKMLFFCQGVEVIDE